MVYTWLFLDLPIRKRRKLNYNNEVNNEADDLDDDNGNKRDDETEQQRNTRTYLIFLFYI